MFKAILARYAVSAVLGLVTVSVVGAVVLSLIRYGGRNQFQKDTAVIQRFDDDTRSAIRSLNASTTRQNKSYRQQQRRALQRFPDPPDNTP